ncbi:MAG: 23S rRNA (uracil(1939)-C(5))-methyltransferase RlmD [Chloroflexota bacterium]
MSLDIMLKQDKAALVEVNLDDWGPRGAVRARLDGRDVLVDRGLPRERAIVEVRKRGRRKQAMVHDVIEPSADRIDAPCPAYALGCGGCQWQHLKYSAQVATKVLLVERELQRAGVDCAISAAHSMEDPWRYRRTAAIAIGWEAGFRPKGRRGIVELHDCLISHPLIGRLADSLNGLLRAGELPNYHGKVWLDCVVVGAGEPKLQILIQAVTGLTLETNPELPQVASVLAALPDVASVAFRHRSGDPVPLTGDLVSRIAVGDRSMYLPAGSFFQTNLDLLPRLLRELAHRVRGREFGQVADVYGGVGALGLSIAHLVERLTLIELDPAAVEAAKMTAAEWGLENVSFVAAHAERALMELPSIDLAIVDPPRSGLGAAVTAALAENASRICYVSCAPASLATDLAHLQQRGFRLLDLQIFDFYPQTYHVESLAYLER